MSESDQAQAINPSGITWDCPEDAQLTWVWNKQAFPEPLTPLMQSYLPYHTQGWAKAARTQGAPGAVHVRFERRLVKSGVLDRAEDVAYLRLDELIQWGFGLADPLRPRVAERKAEHQANRRITPLDFLGVPPAPQEWVDRYEGPPVPLKTRLGEIRGVGASPGIVKGVARIAHTLDEALTLNRGEILACVSADPSWTPLFALVAALVTDAGGSLCHAAVVAREYGIPAVVGTHSATRAIVTGQIVEVDGTQGIVRPI